MSIVFIVSAPSGSGKSTLVNELFKMVHGLDFSVSYTTRAARGSEQNGSDRNECGEVECLYAEKKALHCAADKIGADQAES